MTQGAQRSLRERRRNRLAGVGLATACAALAGVIIATRAPDRSAQVAQIPVHAPVPVTSATELAIDLPPTDPASAATTHLAHDLAQWRAAARGHRSSSHWRTVERAMTRYDLLVRTHAPAAARGPGDPP